MKSEKAYFAGGCFWCLEASFKLVPGVLKVVSGYSGGSRPNPTYKEVCTGKTGHAETVEIEYDPGKVSFDELLEVFFKVHNPSQMDRQGSDVGTEYRSAIFYTSHEQKEEAEKYIQNLYGTGEYHAIYTQVVPLGHFWPAEEYHQNYFEKNPSEAYCQTIVRPKVEKIKEYLKHDYKTVK